MPGWILETLTWDAAAPIIPSALAAVIPIGAASKEHGLHLPLNNDRILADRLAQRVVERSPIALYPTIPYGFYPAFVEYPGSVSLDQNTFRDVLIQTARSIHRHGARHIYFLNTGISTHWSLEPARQALAGEGIVMEYTNLHALIGDVRKRLCTQPAGSHADEMETSMMLHIAPEIVRLARAQRDIHALEGPGPLTRTPNPPRGIYSPTGAWGDPTLATVEKGRELTEAIVDRIVAFLEVFGKDDYVPAPARQEFMGARE